MGRARERELLYMKLREQRNVFSAELYLCESDEIHILMNN